MNTRCGSAGERDEQLELLAREMDGLAAHGDDAREPVDREVADLDQVRARRRRPPQHRSDAGQQLVVDDRPRQVVVRAALERAHPVDRVRLLRAEHDHRDVAVPRPAGLALAEARAEVELGADDEVGARPLGERERLAAERGLEHVEAVARQLALEVAPAWRAPARRAAARLSCFEASNGISGVERCLFERFCDDRSPAVSSGRRCSRRPCSASRPAGAATAGSGTRRCPSRAPRSRGGRRRRDRRRRRLRRRRRQLGAGRRLLGEGRPLAAAARPARRRRPRGGGLRERTRLRRRRLRRRPAAAADRVRARATARWRRARAAAGRARPRRRPRSPAAGSTSSAASTGAVARARRVRAHLGTQTLDDGSRARAPREHLAAAASRRARLRDRRPRAPGSTRTRRDFEVYDAARQRWRRLAPLPRRPRRHRRGGARRAHRLGRRRGAGRHDPHRLRLRRARAHAGRGSPTSRRRGTGSASSRSNDRDLGARAAAPSRA